jgi:DNA-binding SARP family transcriptional activator
LHPVELFVFGAIEARGPSGPIAFTRAKERAVLAALALFRGRAVSNDRLVDAVWGDQPAARVEKALQSHIQRLRAALGPGVIETRSDGYALASDVVVDAERFETEARAGNSTQNLRATLARWTGEPYLDLGEWPPAVLERERLGELRDQMFEACVASEIEAGHAAGCIADLEAMVVDKPLRERRWLLLMTALYRDGRVADALRTYQYARKVFAEELGIDPGLELRALEEEILLAGVESDTADDAVGHVDQLRGSADALLETGDVAGAIQCLDRALAAADAQRVDARVRVDLLLALGNARRQGGNRDGAMNAYREATWIARLYRDPVRVARAALGAAGEGWIAGLDPYGPVLALLDEALELLPEAPSPLRVQVLARLATAEYVSRPFGGADEHAAAALATARVLGHPETLALALFARIATMDLARLSQRRTLADELLNLAHLHGLRDWEAWARVTQARIASIYGAVDDGLMLFDEAATIGEQISSAGIAAVAPFRGVLHATVREGYEAAEHAMGAARDALQRVTAAAPIIHAGEISLLQILHGREPRDDIPSLETFKFGQPTIDALTQALGAAYHARHGDSDGARRALSALDPHTIHTLPHDEFWLPFAWAYSLTCWHTHDAARAADFALLLQPYADLFVVDLSWVFLGAVRHHLGLLCATAGTHNQAEQHLRAALAQHQRLRSPTWAKLTQDALHNIDTHHRN